MSNILLYLYGPGFSWWPKISCTLEVINALRRLAFVVAVGLEDDERKKLRDVLGAFYTMGCLCLALRGIKKTVES